MDPARASRAKRMKELRQGARGAPPKTQAEMAALLGVSLHAYHKWERRGNMTADHVPLFCELVRCTINYYMIGKD